MFLSGAIYVICYISQVTTALKELASTLILDFHNCYHLKNKYFVEQYLSEIATMFLAALVATIFLSTVSCQYNGGSIAFTAAFRSNQVIPSNQIVVYSDVILNLGNGYDSTTGVFTAPRDGVYVFHIHIVSPYGQDALLHLYKNDVSIVSAFGHQVANFGSGGNSVTLTLDAGDKVTVRSRNGAKIYGLADEVYTTFVGYIIAGGC